MYEGIQRHAALFTEHTELRIQENRSVSVAVLNGDVVVNTGDTSSGVSARAYKNGVWGFSSLPAIDDRSIAQAVSTATLNARFLASRENRDALPLPASARSARHDLSTTKARRSRKELIDFVRAVDGWLAQRHPELLSRRVALNCLDVEKALVTSEGAVASSMVPRAILYVILSRRSTTDDTVEAWDVLGGGGQFEDLFDAPEALASRIEELCTHLARKAEGVYPKAGLHDVVLGPDLAGILAHEAIGHTVEADLVLGGSVAGDCVGKQVASELVTLVDFAHTALGKPCPLPLWVDDEGTGAEDAVLIEQGVLRSFLHNKETARKLDARPTGNARASEFHDEPLVRMRNTAILPGTSGLGDLLASVEDGYYLMQPSNGQADSTSEFMFGVSLGYEVKKGKLGRALRDTTVSGVAFEMLKTVTMLSNDMRWLCGGWCGKKQMIPLGMGGPAIRCRITVGGR